jgi:hypothetical protein
LERLEERKVLSTFTLSEFFSGGVPVVRETIDNVTSDFVNPASPFVVNTPGGSNTVNILDTSAGIAISINGGAGSDTVNVGNAGSVQGIRGVLTIQNPHGTDTINVDDSADTTSRVVTLNNGGPTVGEIGGLSFAPIDFSYAGTRVVNITTGSAADTVNVLATGVPTLLSTSGGQDVVNVGFFDNTQGTRTVGNTQGIRGNLVIQNPHGKDTVNVDDSADTTSRVVTLNNDATGTVGEIGGLTFAPIDFSYAGTGAVNITTGSAADTVNVLATGVPTLLSSSGGRDVVNVGNAGSVQGILGGLTIQNPPSFTTLIVDDSADTVARTAELRTIVSGGANFGSITGLAPAAINYKYADTAAVNITTGLGADTINVRATGVATNLSSSGGRDVVNVGDSGSVEGILGGLTIRNPPSFTTLNINDSADTVGRNAVLSTMIPGVGSITGLAPATISFAYADTSTPVNIRTAVGRVSWFVSANARASVTGVLVMNNGLAIN